MKKFMKLGAIALLSAMSMGTLSGCGGNNNGGGGGGGAATGNGATGGTVSGPVSNVSASGRTDTLVFNLGADPNTLDPTRNNAVDGGIIIRNTFDMLVSRDRDLQLVPAAAESWEISDDGLTYTFRLRPEGRWSDGEPVTAGDFEFSWIRALTPEGEAAAVTSLFYIKNAQAFFAGDASREEVGITVIDDLTLEVVLAHPVAYFLETVSSTVFSPLREDIVSANPDTWATDPNTFIGNGRYRMADWTPQTSILLTRNDNHWDAENTLLENVDIRMVSDQVSGYASFRAGIFDVQNNVPAEQIQEGIARGDVYVSPLIGPYYFVFNLDEERAATISSEAAAVIQDVRVRRALNYAIDRYQITEFVTLGGQIPAWSFVPNNSLRHDGTPFSDVIYFPPEGDIERAQQLLAEAGFPNGEGFPTLFISYNTGAGHSQIAQAIQFMWLDALGINVQLQQADWGVFIDQRNNGDFVIARHGATALTFDPFTWLSQWETVSPTNVAFFSHPEYDALIEAIRQELDLAVRDDLMRQAEDILMEYMIVIPLYYYVNHTAIHPHVQGLRICTFQIVLFHEVVIS